MKLNLEQGKKLIGLAKRAVYSGEIDSEEFKEKRGIFVTLHSYPELELRGCVGFPEPILPLGTTICEAAKAAAYEDPRFTPLRKNEKIIFEISVLTEPKLIKVKNSEEYLNKIKIGRDGLIIDCEGMNGLLLPQVAIEQKWDVKTFLDNLCLKAGLLEETWKEGECKIYSFEAQIFYEKSPDGEIVERN